MCRASHESQTVREILQELENGAQGINKGIGSFLLSLLKKSCAPFSSSWRISRTARAAVGESVVLWGLTSAPALRPFLRGFGNNKLQAVHSYDSMIREPGSSFLTVCWVQKLSNTFWANDRDIKGFSFQKEHVFGRSRNLLE